MKRYLTLALLVVSAPALRGFKEVIDTHIQELQMTHDDNQQLLDSILDEQQKATETDTAKALIHAKTAVEAHHDTIKKVKKQVEGATTEKKAVKAADKLEDMIDKIKDDISDIEKEIKSRIEKAAKTGDSSHLCMAEELEAEKAGKEEGLKRIQESHDLLRKETGTSPDEDDDDDEEDDD